METRIPSQQAHWTLEQDEYGWRAQHDTWERGDVSQGEGVSDAAGGPICAGSFGADLVDVLVEVVEIESEGNDFGAFVAQLEARTERQPGQWTEARLAAALLDCLPGFWDARDFERLEDAFEDALHVATLTGTCGCGDRCKPEDGECYACAARRAGELR